MKAVCLMALAFSLGQAVIAANQRSWDIIVQKQDALIRAAEVYRKEAYINGAPVPAGDTPFLEWKRNHAEQQLTLLAIKVRESGLPQHLVPPMVRRLLLVTTVASANVGPRAVSVAERLSRTPG